MRSIVPNTSWPAAYPCAGRLGVGDLDSMWFVAGVSCAVQCASVDSAPERRPAYLPRDTCTALLIPKVYHTPAFATSSQSRSHRRRHDDPLAADRDSGRTLQNLHHAARALYPRSTTPPLGTPTSRPELNPTSRTTPTADTASPRTRYHYFCHCLCTHSRRICVAPGKLPHLAQTHSSLPSILSLQITLV